MLKEIVIVSRVQQSDQLTIIALINYCLLTAHVCLTLSGGLCGLRRRCDTYTAEPLSFGCVSWALPASSSATRTTYRMHEMSFMARLKMRIRKPASAANASSQCLRAMSLCLRKPKFKFKFNKINKLAPCGTDGRLFTTDVSAKFKVTWHKN